MNKRISLIGFVLALALMTACAKEVPPPAVPEPVQGPLATVVLLADPSGHVGRVVVTDIRGGTEVLKMEKEAVQVGPDRRLMTPAVMSNAEIERLFGAALRAFPDAPITFILYFRGKTTTLTAESKRLLDEIGDVYRSRKAASVRVVGHTSRSGDQRYNLIISDKRAQMISKLLFKQERIPWTSMDIDSYGEAFPLVETKDGKTESDNQRVEVTIH